MTTPARKAAIVLPPVDDDRLLSRTGGPILWSQSVPARGSRTMDTRPKAVAQVVSDVRLGYRRPSIG